MPSLTYKEAARRVLADAGTPLHAHEIARRALDTGLVVPLGKAPQATMEAALCVASRCRRGPPTRCSSARLRAPSPCATRRHLRPAWRWRVTTTRPCPATAASAFRTSSAPPPTRRPRPSSAPRLASELRARRSIIAPIWPRIRCARTAGGATSGRSASGLRRQHDASRPHVLVRTRPNRVTGSRSVGVVT